MFFEELRIMDINTVEYMIEVKKKELEALKRESEALKKEKEAEKII